MNAFEHTIRCVPYGIALGEGADCLIDAPPLEGPASQTDWYHRRVPTGFVPRDAVSSQLLGERDRVEGSWGAQPNALLAACAVGDRLAVMTVAGPSRNIISAACFPFPNASVDKRDVESDDVNENEVSWSEWPEKYRPFLLRTAAPVQQLALNVAAQDGWRRLLSYENQPLLAARSLYGLEIFQVNVEYYDSSNDAMGGRERSRPATKRRLHRRNQRPLVDGQMPSITLNAIGNFLLPYPQNRRFDGDSPLLASSSRPCVGTDDFAWSPYFTERGVVLTHDGRLYESSLAMGAKHALTCTLAYQPSEEDRPPSGIMRGRHDSHDYGRCRCTFTARHPRHVALALEDSLNIVDLRGGGTAHSDVALKLYRCSAGEWISAVAAPPPRLTRCQRDSSSSTGGDYGLTMEHYIAAATSSRVLLFDLRRPNRAVAEWKHDFHPVDVRKDLSVLALRHMVPDHLFWLSPWQCRTTLGALLSHGNRGGDEGIMDSYRHLPFHEASVIVPSTIPAAASCDCVAGIGRLLVSNSWSSRGVVCEWSQAEPSDVSLTLDGGGKIFDRNVEFSDDIDPSRDSQPLLQGIPVFWTDVTPVESPLLLYDRDLYPPPFVAAKERSFTMQRARLERCLRSSIAPISNIEPKQAIPETVGLELIRKEWSSHDELPNPVLITTGAYQQTLFSLLSEDGALETLQRNFGFTNRVPDVCLPGPVDEEREEHQSLELIREARVDLPLKEDFPVKEIKKVKSSKSSAEASAQNAQKEHCPDENTDSLFLPFHCWLLSEVLRQYWEPGPEPLQDLPLDRRVDNETSGGIRSHNRVTSMLEKFLLDSDVSVTAWEAFYASSCFAGRHYPDDIGPDIIDECGLLGETGRTHQHSLHLEGTRSSSKHQLDENARSKTGIKVTEKSRRDMQNAMDGIRGRVPRSELHRIGNAGQNNDSIKSQGSDFIACLHSAGMVPIPKSVKAQLDVLRRRRWRTQSSDLIETDMRRSSSLEAIDALAQEGRPATRLHRRELRSRQWQLRVEGNGRSMESKGANPRDASDNGGNDHEDPYETPHHALLAAANSSRWRCKSALVPFQKDMDQLLRNVSRKATATSFLEDSGQERDKTRFLWQAKSPSVVFEDSSLSSDRATTLATHKEASSHADVGVCGAPGDKAMIPGFHRITGEEKLPGQTVAYPFTVKSHVSGRSSDNLMNIGLEKAGARASAATEESGSDANLKQDDLALSIRIIRGSRISVSAEAQQIIERLQEDW